MNDRGFPEKHELSNQLYALIAPTLEKYEARGSNGHHRAQAITERVVDEMHSWILNQKINGEVHGDKPVPPPTDMTARILTDGSPVTEDHRDLKPNGQQKEYVVLSEDERKKGYVRPVRRTYTHLNCGSDTTMSQAIAETYAREPKFYNGTFCVRCQKHLPLAEFVWKDAPTETVGS